MREQRPAKPFRPVRLSSACPWQPSQQFFAPGISFVFYLFHDVSQFLVSAPLIRLAKLGRQPGVATESLVKVRPLDCRKWTFVHRSRSSVLSRCNRHAKPLSREVSRPHAWEIQVLGVNPVDHKNCAEIKEGYTGQIKKTGDQHVDWKDCGLAARPAAVDE